MIHKSLAPGMEDCDDAQFSIDPPVGVSGEVLQGLADAVEQRSQRYLLIAEYERV